MITRDKLPRVIECLTHTGHLKALVQALLQMKKARHTNSNNLITQPVIPELESLLVASSLPVQGCPSLGNAHQQQKLQMESMSIRCQRNVVHWQSPDPSSLWPRSCVAAVKKLQHLGRTSTWVCLVWLSPGGIKSLDIFRKVQPFRLKGRWCWCCEKQTEIQGQVSKNDD